VGEHFRSKFNLPIIRTNEGISMESKNWLKRTVTHALFWLCICNSVVAEETAKSPFESTYWNYGRFEKCQMIWGDETNGIKSGLQVLVITNKPDAAQNDVWGLAWLLFQTNSATKFYVGRNNSNTNCFVEVVEGTTTTWTNGHSATLPSWATIADAVKLVPIERNYQVNLTDENGVEVERTSLGEKLRRTFLDNSVYKPISWSWDDASLVSGELHPFVVNFHLNDFFKLTKPGKYHFQMQLRIFCCYANGTPYERYEPLILPPIDVEFILPKN